MRQIAKKIFLIAVGTLVPLLLRAEEKNIEILDPINITGGAYDLYGRLIRMFVGIVGAAAFFFFIYGGVLWLTSGGSEEKIKQGKATIVWAVLGLVVVFGSYIVLSYIITELSTPTT